jgi:hypothetical protein
MKFFRFFKFSVSFFMKVDWSDLQLCLIFLQEVKRGGHSAGTPAAAESAPTFGLFGMKAPWFLHQDAQSCTLNSAGLLLQLARTDESQITHCRPRQPEKATRKVAISQGTATKFPKNSLRKNPQKSIQIHLIWIFNEKSR